MSVTLPLLKLSASEKLIPRIPLLNDDETDSSEKSKTPLHSNYDSNLKPASSRDDLSPSLKNKVFEVMKYEQRNSQEARVLYNYLRHTPFFASFHERNPYNNFDADDFVQLCLKARYEKHPAYKVLYKEGDTPTGKAYIILSGSVYTDSKNSEDKTEYSTQAEVSIVDSIVEKSPDTTPKSNDSHDFSANPSKLFDPSPLNKKSRSSIRITSNSLSPKNGLFNHLPEGKPGKKSRFSVFVTDPNECNEIKDPSEIALSKFVRKATQIPEEKSSVSTKLGFSSFLQMNNYLSNIQENTQVESEILKDNEEASSQTPRTSRRRKNSKVKFGSESTENKVHSSLDPVELSLSKHYPVLPGKKSKITEGGFFGERALFSREPRSSTVMTSTECEFLVISKKDFRNVNEKYEMKKRHVFEFLKEYLPEFESLRKRVIDELIDTVQEKTFERGTFIAKEGDPANHIILLYGGTCDLIKKVKIDESSNLNDTLGSLKKLVRVNPVYSQDLYLGKVEKGEIVGKECVYSHKEVYDLSMKAYSAQVKVFLIEKDDFFLKFPVQIREKIERRFIEKRKHRCTISSQLIEQKFPLLKLVDGDLNERQSDLLSRSEIRLVPKKKAEMNEEESMVYYSTLVDSPTDPNLRRKLDNFSRTTKSPSKFESPLFTFPPERSQTLQSKDEERQGGLMRQDSLEIFLRSMAQDHRDITKIKATKGVLTSKKLEASPKEGTQYSFTKVLEKMMTKAQHRKNRRINDDCTVMKTVEKPGEGDSSCKSNKTAETEYTAGMRTESRSVGTPRLPKEMNDYFPHITPLSVKKQLTGKSKSTRNFNIKKTKVPISNLIRISVIEKTQTSTAGGLVRTISRRGSEISETDNDNVVTIRPPLRKRSSLYQRALKRKYIKGEGVSTQNDQEGNTQSEYYFQNDSVNYNPNNEINDDSQMSE